jgi:hypothetical protein
MQGVYVLLPVWGARYLRQCLDVCIPSLLAAGNVPAIAALLPTTFVLMTRDRDMAMIRGHRAWLALAAVCDARLASIDDLLSEAASFVLTLAYARQIRALGPGAREFGFIFLVSDYIVADGSLRHVLGVLQGGADAVLAGNFQMSREAIDKQPGMTRRGGGEALSISPRDLVRLALDWLHPATIACMPNEAAGHDPRANRVFWRVSPDTLLGRFYLMHMVAIRPKTVDVTIAAPCDYSFVPEFCPSGRVETITDSDDYLVVEIQPVSAGAQATAPGKLDPPGLAKSLTEWVTAWHRGNAAHPIVYHAVDTGPELAAVIDRSAVFVSETNRLLGSTVRPHRHHPYWAGAVDHHRATAVQPVDWTALEAILGPGGVPKDIAGLRQRLLGRMPSPRPWHPHWTDLRVVLERLARLASGRSLLIVSTEPDVVRKRLIAVARSAGARNVMHLEPGDVFGSATESRARFDAALIVVRLAAFDMSHEYFRSIAEMVADDAPVVLALSELSDAGALALSPADVESAVERIGDGLVMERMETVPAPNWRITAQAEMMARARQATRANGYAGRMLDLIAAMFFAGVSLMANLACLRGMRRPGRRACSTALLHLVRERRAASVRSEPMAQAMADTWTA